MKEYFIEGIFHAGLKSIPTIIPAKTTIATAVTDAIGKPKTIKFSNGKATKNAAIPASGHLYAIIKIITKINENKTGVLT